VTVAGAGSAWTNNGILTVGESTYSLDGRLHIRNGGSVTANSVSVLEGKVYAKPLLSMDVGRGSSLVVNNGSGTITNDGVVRLLAGANVATGDYSPISAGTWSGSGIYQGVGGTWDSDTHVFTVSGAQSGVSGQEIELDLASTQRALFTDSTTGWNVGASFLSTASSTPLSFTATAVSGDVMSGLQITSGGSVLGGWSFEADGYTPGDPVYLTFAVGAGFSAADLGIWHYDGDEWTEYAPDDLTYDGQYASFTVTGFSGYAVTNVPEPATMAMLVIGGLAILKRRRK
jgi:T5SS/PEP-CTERM-associated repeat protein